MTEDTALLSGFKAGDHESFEKLMLKYRNSALRFAMGFVREVHDAEDIVQDSFADLYVFRDRYRMEYSFKTYLYSIIKNKCISRLRKSNCFLLNEDSLPCEESAEYEYLEYEKRSLVREKINQLKTEYRIVLYLKEYDGFSYEEIAGITGKNTGQVKILLFRARKKLKMLLDREVAL